MDTAVLSQPRRSELKRLTLWERNISSLQEGVYNVTLKYEDGYLFNEKLIVAR